jgi:uncharacterized protein (TIGR04255 family)
MSDHKLNNSGVNKIKRLSMSNIKYKPQEYNKPPIVEALISIQVQPGKDVADNYLEKIYKKLEPNYPNKENFLLKTAAVDVQNEQTSFITREAGLKLSSPDKKYVIQIKKTELTFSILNEYHGWDDLCRNTKAIWKDFIEQVKPLHTTRVATRFINRIDIPALRFEPRDYFNVYPHTFDGIDLSGFFMQLQIPQQPEGGLAILHQAASPPVKAGYTSILLDMDIFDFKNFPPDSDDLWKRMDILRAQKNVLFENCITDKTRELFS